MTHELPADVARAVVAVAQRLAGEAGDVATEAADRIVVEVPEYERYADGGDRAELVVAVRAVVDTFLDLAPTLGRLSDGQRAEVADIGERRAREGRSLAAVTDALAVGLDVARARVFAAFRELSPRRSEWAAIEAVVGTLDRFGHDVADAFREGHGRVDVEERRDRDRARDALLTTLLADPARDLRQARARAAELDLDLTPPLALVALVAPLDAAAPDLPAGSAGESFEGRASRVARALPAPSLGPVPIEPGGAGPRVLCAVVPDATGRRRHDTRLALEAECARLGLTALHATVPTVAHLHPALVRLLAAAPVAERLADRCGRVAEPEALWGHRLADAATLAEQEHELRSAVGPLQALPKTAGEHVATLRALLEEQFNMAAAGRRLGVSPEAVANRVARIEALTGLSLRDRRHSRRFDVALCLLDLYDDVLPGPGDAWWTDDTGASTLSTLFARGGAPPAGGDPAA